MELIILVIIHFVADFVFQSESWAINKSKDNLALTTHVAVYSVIIGIGLLAYPANFHNYNILLFCTITFFAHFITDYYTSRLVSQKRKQENFGGDVPNFGMFTIIGFDQVLHYLQLYITAHYIL